MDAAKVQAALTYPIFLVGFFIVVMIIATFWIIPMFRNIYLSNILLFGGSFQKVPIFAINKHNNVCILFDRTRFPQIRKPRHFVVPLVNGPRKLGKRKDGHFKLARKRFKAPRDLGDLCNHIVRICTRPNKLEIVNNQKPKTVLNLQSPRHRAHLHNIESRGIINKNRDTSKSIKR